MFEDSMLRNAPKKRRAWTIAVSLACQVVGVGVAILIPLVAFDKLPMARFGSGPLMRPPEQPGTEKPEAPKKFVKVVDVKWQTRGKQLVLPHEKYIPAKALRIVDPPRPPEFTGPGTGVIGGVPKSGLDDGVIGGVTRMAAESYRAKAEQTPAEKKPVVKVEPPVTLLRISTMSEARLLQRVEPVYPRLAREMRVQGTVRLQAVIDRDGRIRELTLLSGHPLLAPAALDAVRQWVYRPTTLNGVTVEVLTTVDVHFILGR